MPSIESRASVALKRDGTVVEWGKPLSNWIGVPDGLHDVVSICGGFANFFALKKDGTVVIWGGKSALDAYGSWRIPDNLAGVRAIAAGISHNVVLLGDGSPYITYQPVGQALYGRATGFLSVGAVGDQPMSYQWQLNGVDIPSATESVLTLPNLQAAHSGDYRVVVSNAKGQVVSAVVTLNVDTRPPTIQQQPAPLNVAVTSDATFSVGASGAEPLTYQWYRDGNLLPGATNSSYTVFHAQASDAGIYTVTVSNPIDTVTSQKTGLTVYYNPPIIIRQPVGTNVFAGVAVTLSVSAGGSPPLSYQWYKNGVSLLNATNYFLTISKAGTNDAGDYRVVVSNPDSNVSSDVARLDVVGPPANDFFTNRIVITGQTNTVIGYNFLATRETGEPMVAGTTSPSSVWWSWLAPASGLVTIDTIGSTLDTVLGIFTGNTVSSLNLVASNDDISNEVRNSRVTFAALCGTTYQIVVGGYGTSVGNISLNLRQPYVTGAPFIITPPQPQRVAIGDSATFSVLATGDSPMSYQWSFNGTTLAGVTNVSLTVAAQTTNAGPYTVVVTNGRGAALASAVLSLSTHLRYSAFANRLRLEWTGISTLQSATNVQGPYLDMPATSPYTNQIGKEPSRFYRIRQ